MADRIGIIVELTGDKEAQHSLDELRKAVREMKSEKVSLSLESANIDRKINELKRELASLTEIKRTIKLDGGNTANIDERIRAIRDMIDSLTRHKKDIQIDANVDSTALRAANDAIKEMTQNSITLSDVLSGIGDVFSSIGNGLQSIGRMFGGDVLNTARRTLTAYGTIMATQGFKKAGTRFDTFRTFPKLMEAAGYSSEEATQAVNDLNEAVLGLPTPLDEMVDSAKQYIMLTNDIKKGTDLAIASNNAFLANASDASQVKFGMRQIRDILSKGTLRSQEWDSLFGSMGISLAYVAEAFGYTREQVGQFRSDLKEGRIDAMDFIDALIAAGTGTGKLAELAEIQKDTLDAATTNLKTAFANLGASAMQALDDVLKEGTGEGLPGNIKRVSDAIKQDLIPAVKDWVGAHSDDIMNFIDKLASYDWMGLASKIGTSVYDYFKLLGRILDAIPQDALQSFVAWAMVWATPVGKAFSLLGSIFKGLATLNVAGIPVLGKLARGGEIGKTITSLSEMGKAFAGFSITVAEIAEIGLVIAEYAKIVQMIADIKLGDNFLKNAGAVAGTLGAGGAITAIITGLMSLAGKSGAGAIGVGIGELLSMGFIAELGLLGEVIGKYAEICQKISDLDVNWERTTTNALGIGMVMTELNLAAAVNSLAGIAGVIGAAELTSISDAVGAVMDAMDQIAKANFPTPEKLRLAKTMFSDLTKTFDLGFVEGFKAFVGGLFNVYEAEKDKIDKSIEVLKMYDDVADVVDSLAGKKIKADAAGANLTTLTNSLNTMLGDILDTFGGDSGLSNAMRWTRNSATLMTNMKNMFTNLGEVMNEIRNIQTAYFGQGKIEGVYQPSIMSGFKDTKQNIIDFIKGANDILDILNPQNSLATAWEEEWETSSQARTLSNIQKAFGSLGKTMTSLKKIKKEFGKLSKDMSVGGAIGYVKANLMTAMTQIKALFESDAFKNLPDLGKITYRNEKDTESTMVGKIAAIASAVKSFKDIMYALRVINGDLTSGKGESIDFSSVTGNIQAAVEGLSGVFGAIPEDMEGTVLEKVTALQSAVTQLQTVVTTLQGIQTSLSGEEGGSMDTGGLTQMITDITTALSSAQIDTSGLETIASSVENLKNMLSEVSMVDFSALAGQVDTVKSGLGSLRDEAVSAQRALENLGSAGSGALGRITGMFNSIISQCNSAISSVNNLQAAINGLHGKTVTINVQKKGSVSAPTGSGYVSTGGFIGANGAILYRASGGSIFRPRGTDTVPAMLTPGEYVMRRRAVQAFGVDFMRNINRLNIPGALRNLVSRTSFPMTHSTVINNTKDNHATVNQNFYNSNPAFAFRRANRYVEAL